jgi:cobalamin biosynthesis protein CobD/CbiB
MAYKAINTLDSMVGYKTEKYKNFGWASARLDDIANYIPARITGILIVVTTFIFNIIVRSSRLQNGSRLNNIEPLNNFKQDLKKLDGFNAIKIMIRDGKNHPSPNSGVPEAAMAGALGVQLGGPSRYGGIIVDKPYIGEDLLEDSSRWLNIVQNSSSLNNVEPLNKFEQFSARSIGSYERYLQASENAIFIVKISSFSGFCTALLIVCLKALL